MACEFEVCIPAGTREDGTGTALESLDLVESLEQRLSFFRLDSEISRINLLAAEEPVEVEPDLFELLQTAFRLSDETGGAYDITATPLWEAWGFARRAGEIPSDAQLAEARSLVGWRLVELDPVGRTIRFCKAGVKINVGSIGKGFALNVCAAHLLTSGINDFLLHGGQSSVLARGTPGSRDGIACGQAVVQGGWEVGVSDPQRPGRRVGIVKLRDRALGTSGGQFQSFRYRGRRYGHLLDPRSGLPAEGALSVTVLASSAALADALSTAFYVLGLEESLRYCERHPEVGMVMLWPAAGGKVEVHRMGVDDGDFLMTDI